MLDLLEGMASIACHAEDSIRHYRALPVPLDRKQGLARCLTNKDSRGDHSTAWVSLVVLSTNTLSDLGARTVVKMRLTLPRSVWRGDT